ncbi:lytic transglycosylase catalytic subunit [Anopheles sinensis]|uniref:Lytic transglycosylase catalytic subunit n=1 Tax=Anopheles sinensis TaxID=74873 RepID=A0A084WDH5_ANOSI|nr:lytic transglycosylase catalytic subunit [Anopheles sinensis]
MLYAVERSSPVNRHFGGNGGGVAQKVAHHREQRRLCMHTHDIGPPSAGDERFPARALNCA